MKTAASPTSGNISYCWPSCSRGIGALPAWPLCMAHLVPISRKLKPVCSMPAGRRVGSRLFTKSASLALFSFTWLRQTVMWNWFRSWRPWHWPSWHMNSVLQYFSWRGCHSSRLPTSLTFMPRHLAQACCFLIIWNLSAGSPAMYCSQ